LDEEKSKHVGLAQQNGFGSTLLRSWGLISDCGCSEVAIFAGGFQH